MNVIIVFFTGLIFVSPVMAKSIAVTDLAYSQTLQEYIHEVDYHNTSKLSGSESHRLSTESASSKTDYHEYEHNFSYVEYGELKKFTGDIRGALINSRQFTVVQAKPSPMARHEGVYDIIARIKKGDFPHADYVLFGRLSDISFNNSTYQVNDSMTNFMLNLALTAEFSLINTKNYEVIASFTATGEGQDTKILTPGTYATPNRSAVVSQVSKTLGQDVFRQIDEQVFDRATGESVRNLNGESRQNNGIEPPPQKTQGVTVFQ
jgi:hypothetical protein